MTLAVIVAGILGPIEDFLAAVIDWLGPHGPIGLPWAWAIVALTVIVRMALVPLTVKQIHSMQNLQRHAPEMKEIQRKYKGDRAKMNEELMAFYKENSINPASSCLPIIFQIPIFIALFFVLRDFEDTTDYERGDNLEWLGLVTITDPANEGWGDPAPRHLRREPARVHVLHVGDDGANAATDLLRAALPLHPVHRELRGRPRPLLGDDEPLDGRAGHRHAAARAAHEGGAAEEELADAAQG